MKEYRMVYLNKGLNFSRENDLKAAETVLNQYVSDGWELQQIVSPADLAGALVAVMHKEKE